MSGKGGVLKALAEKALHVGYCGLEPTILVIDLGPRGAWT
jgi:hypothetical protein